MTSSVKYDILWLQISEDDLVLVQVLKSNNHLCNVQSGFTFRNFVFNLNLVSQITSWAEFHDKIKSVLILESIIEPNHHRMVSSYTQTVPFCQCIFSQIIVIDLMLFKEFHCKQLWLTICIESCFSIPRNSVNSTKGSTAKGIQDVEILKGNLLLWLPKLRCCVHILNTNGFTSTIVCSHQILILIHFSICFTWQI